MFECRVLGPTQVLVGGVQVGVGGPLPRRLLTALVAAEGRVVADDQLVEALWGADPPGRALSTLQVYVSRLRAALGAHGRELERHGSGYRIRPGGVATDAQRFAAAVEEGTRRLAEDRAGQALEILSDALALWRGEAFADLLAPPDGVRSRLAELREVAVEQRLAARLAIGDTAGAVAELEGAVRDQPYRERRWALLIVGLYRCGRQADALAALRRVRGVLAGELGVDPGPELQELERRILAQDPRLLLPEPSAPGRPVSSFLGRESEVDTLDRLLARRRLVTLVGPAGVGKTRVAVEYLAGRGAWLVRLADVSEPHVLARAVADAVGLAEVAGDPRQALIRSLGDRAGLLVLDNCEHLVGAVAELATELLTGCPRVRILATSRGPLEVDGEVTLPVGPLPVDTAVALLVDRVRTVRPQWTPSQADLRHARQVCQALDGLPLALELAAARARVLSLGEIAGRLDDRFAVLGPVPRGSLTPHATLHEAVAWSFELLPDTERALLVRLWPFEGGFPLEAAGALESLSSLVSQSMIMADTTMTPTRYRMLETIRAFCRAADPDPAATRAAHAAWIRELAWHCADDLVGERSGRATRVLAREWPNLRAGIAHDLEHDPALALRTSGRLDWFWNRSGHITEGRRLLAEALRAAPDSSTVDRAHALAVSANMAYYAGDVAEGRRLGAETFATLGEPADRDQRLLHGRVLYYLALGKLHTKEIDAARAAAEQVIAVARREGSDWLMVGGRMALGAALTLHGQPRHGEEILVETATRAERLGLFWFAGWSEHALAKSLISNGRSADAGRALRRALDHFQREDDATSTVTVLHVAVAALTHADRLSDAARLRAAVFQHAQRLGLGRDSVVREGLEPIDLDRLLDPARRAAAEAEGVRLSWSQMLDLMP